VPELFTVLLVLPADCNSKVPDVSEVSFNPPEVSAFTLVVILYSLIDVIL